MRDRLIQLSCIALAIVALLGGGALLPRIVAVSDERGMRYTDVSVEGAPPIVALGTAIGTLRGIIVDYLWIKATWQKQAGLFHEAMADADLITKLQPRFGEVWAFHGHNMAYNISVLTNTPEERWSWVKAGIDLVRNKGIRYNPNDLILYKELAFWFAHKVDSYSDDAHLHYKRELAREWQMLLGTPPVPMDQRIAWIEAIKDAPDTLEEAEARTPGVKALVERLTGGLSGFDRRFQFALDRQFLMNHGRWAAVKESPYAKLLQLDERYKANDPVYAEFDRVFADPANEAALRTLILFLRKKVLRDDYNMDPAVMWEFTRDAGPLDWRHPQAHAYYWATLGQKIAEKRSNTDDDVYKIVNNDRVSIQAMQAMARSGLVIYDPFSGDNPGRLTDPRWIKAIDRYFTTLYEKHYGTRGAGGDTFCDFYENFMSSAVCELYHIGDYEGAQAILDRLDRLFGRTGLIPNSKYESPLDTFVVNTTRGEYEYQPEYARRDVYGWLERGFREGLLLGRPKILEDAIRESRNLIEFFQGNRYYDFVNRFGEKRMADLVSDLRDSVRFVFQKVMLDASQPIYDRLTMYNKAPEEQRRLVYDDIKGPLAAEYAANPLSQMLPIERALPEPPGMDEFRAARAAEAAKKAEQPSGGRSSDAETK